MSYCDCFFERHHSLFDDHNFGGPYMGESLCWAVDGAGKSYQIISVCTYSVAGTLQGTHQQLIKIESFRLSDGRLVDRITEDEFKVLTDGLRLRRVSASPIMNSNT